MSAMTDPIAKGTTLPRGAVFHRCALQVNPFDYGGRFRGQEQGGTAETHAQAIVDKAASMGVSVLGITNHNDVGGVAAFRDAAEGRPITVFPGFELCSSEGIHVLCLYAPDTSEEQLGRFLGKFGIDNTEPSSDLSPETFEAVLSMVRQQGGVAVAGHITHDKGLFKVLSGQARIKAWKSEDLLAVQIPRLVEDLAPEFRKIVENKNPHYRRSHPAGHSLAMAAVNARDIVGPEDLEQPAATCWIKMSEVSVEGLRQAFLDPLSRVRLNPAEGELETDEHAELVTLAWEGGFLDGATINLNPNLNVLVGGRGAGKSTVIESLRYVFGLEPIGAEAAKAHESIVRNVLRNGTKVSLLVRCRRPATRDYRIERTVPNPPVVRDQSGQVSNLQPEAIVPRLEVYGQHEVSELTASSDKLTRLLDRFVTRDPSLRKRKGEIRRELERTRRSALEVLAELEQIDERLECLPSLEETLERFREAGLEERLRDRSLLVREERVLEAMTERLLPLREGTEALRQQIPIDRVFLTPKALEGLPGREILSAADGVLERVSNDVARVVGQLEEALSRTEEDLGAVRRRWMGRKREIDLAYQRILRELQESSVDGEEFIRLRGEIEGLRPLRERGTLLRRSEKEQADRRRTLLAEWEDLKAEEFRLVDRAARRVGRRLRGRVRVEVRAAGNRERLIRVLREGVGGRLSEAIEVLSTAKDFSLPKFVAACREGAESVERSFPIPPAQAKRLVGVSPETLMRMEELELPATTEIWLNTAPLDEPEVWQALEDLSTGQKATAVLLLLLLESDAPLIVDQPEDDLDNRFITESVVPKMREEKQRRQFVFSTHNANIPVLGDAEMILGLTAAGEAGNLKAHVAREHMGSIDSQSVRELVEELLEGGKEAFEMRRLKYGF